MAAKLKLDLDSTGIGLIEVDGLDISHLVSGMAIDVNPGSDLTVRIQLIPVAIAANGEFDDVDYAGPQPELGT